MLNSEWVSERSGNFPIELYTNIYSGLLDYSKLLTRKIDWSLEDAKNYDTFKYPSSNRGGVKKTYEQYVGSIIDRKLLAKVLMYVSNFVNKDEDSINFFGGNLLGVYQIKFLVTDLNEWVYEVLNIEDYEGLRDTLYNLPDINKDWNVSSDAANLSFLWLASAALKSTNLNEKERMQLATAAINMMQYKFASSLHTQRFPYRANMDISLALFESLNDKFQLRRLGTWKALFDDRTSEILSPNFIYYKTLIDYNNDGDIVKMVNDIWNKTKSIFNVLSSKFYELKEANAKISSSNVFVTVGDNVLLKDSVNKYTKLKHHLHEIVPDKNQFIREDLLDIVVAAVETVPREFLMTTLLYFTNNYTVEKEKELLEGVVDDTMVFVLDMIRTKKMDLKNIPDIALSLRMTFKSSRILSPLFRDIKDRLAIIIEIAIPKIDAGTLASIRIGLLLYISIRALLLK